MKSIINKLDKYFDLQGHRYYIGDIAKRVQYSGYVRFIDIIGDKVYYKLIFDDSVKEENVKVEWGHKGSTWVALEPVE